MSNHFHPYYYLEHYMDDVIDYYIEDVISFLIVHGFTYEAIELIWRHGLIMFYNGEYGNRVRNYDNDGTLESIVEQARRGGRGNNNNNNNNNNGDVLPMVPPVNMAVEEEFIMPMLPEMGMGPLGPAGMDLFEADNNLVQQWFNYDNQAVEAGNDNNMGQRDLVDPDMYLEEEEDMSHLNVSDYIVTPADYDSSISGDNYGGQNYNMTDQMQEAVLGNPFMAASTSTNNQSMVASTSTSNQSMVASTSTNNQSMAAAAVHPEAQLLRLSSRIDIVMDCIQKLIAKAGINDNICMNIQPPTILVPVYSQQQLEYLSAVNPAAAAAAAATMGMAVNVGGIYYVRVMIPQLALNNHTAGVPPMPESMTTVYVTYQARTLTWEEYNRVVAFFDQIEENPFGPN